MDSSHNGQTEEDNRCSCQDISAPLQDTPQHWSLRLHAMTRNVNTGSCMFQLRHHTWNRWDNSVPCLNSRQPAMTTAIQNITTLWSIENTPKYIHCNLKADSQSIITFDTSIPDTTGHQTTIQGVDL